MSEKPETQNKCANYKSWQQSEQAILALDPLKEYFEIFQVREDSLWFREELTGFFEDLQLIKHKKTDLSHRIKKKVLTEEGLSHSLEQMILNQFYQLAFMENFQGLSENNYSFLQLYKIVIEYKFFNARHIDPIFNTDQLTGLDLEAKANFYINQIKLPSFLPCSKEIVCPENALEDLTKYFNISLALTVYSYLCFEKKKETLSWSCLVKARELLAYSRALEILLKSDKNIKVSLGKTKGYRRKDLQFELFLSFIELELLKPEKLEGWVSTEQAARVIADRFETQQTRVYLLFECERDFEKRYKKNLRLLIEDWIVKYDTLKFIFEKNRLNQDEYEFQGKNYYPFKPDQEFGKLYSFSEVELAPRLEPLKKTKGSSKILISKKTLSSLEELASNYALMKFKFTRLQQRVSPELAKFDEKLELTKKEQLDLKDAQIDFLLKELKKKDRKTDFRDLLRRHTEEITNESLI